MPKNKLDILKEVLGSAVKSGNEYLFQCQFCSHHKKKLSVNLTKDKYKCWICDSSGPVSRLVKRFGNFHQVQAWKDITGQIEVSEFEKILLGQAEFKLVEPEQVIELPEEFTSLCNMTTALPSVMARNYLNSRGISKADILRWKLGYCSSGEYEGRIIAPSFNMDGKVNFFVGRTYENNWKKYTNPSVNKDIIFNELYVDWDHDIVLVEGVFDAIKVPNSIPILGSTLREDSKLFKSIIKHDPAVYVALDPDADSKAMKLIQNLMKYDVEVYKVPIRPYKDIGEMSSDEFLRRKASSELFKDTDSILLSQLMSI
jgi:DNA primase